MVMVRSTDTTLQEKFDDILDRLAADTNDELLRHISATGVVDLFWPAADGWATVAVEPGVDYVTWVLTHPTRGVAACMLMTLDRDDPTTRRATPGRLG